MTREAVHAAATLGKRFEALLKRACKNYGELMRVGALENRKVRREPPPEYPEEERREYYDAVEEYDKIVEAFEKLAKSKAAEDFYGWSYGEHFVKWAGKKNISVGYLGVWRERAAEYFLMDIPLYELPLDKTVADLYELYEITRFEIFKIPTQHDAEMDLLGFLEHTKKWPLEWLSWIILNVYPLTDETGGFWRVISKVLALKSLRDAWEDIIEKVEDHIRDELRKTPQYEVLKRKVGDLDAARYIGNWVREAKEEIVEKYANKTEDPDKVKNEFFARAREIFAERVVPETKILEVYEQIKTLIPPEKVELTRRGLYEAISWAFIHPQISVDALASAKIFPLMFTEEEAKQIAAKILEKVTKKPVPVEIPPKIELVAVRVLEDLPAIVGVDLKTYGPFKKREVYTLPKENAEALVKQGVAVYEAVYPQEYEKELSTVKSEIEKLGKFERLAYFLNNRLKWRLITIEDQKEMLRKIVEGWTDKDYQTFYDMYPEKVKDVPPTFTLLGLKLPPPPTPPETVPALKAELEEEERRRREAELLLIEEKKKLEAIAPAVEVAPPPIKEPVPEEEQVVKRECYEIFRRLWDEIKKTAAMEVGIPTVSRRTGIGAAFIRKALATAYEKQLEKIERLANSLTECQCEIELKEAGAGHSLGVVKKCQSQLENQKK